MAWSAADLRTIGYFAGRPAPRPAGLDRPLAAQRALGVRHAGGPRTGAATGQGSGFVRYGLRSLPVMFAEVGEVTFDLSKIAPEPIPKEFVRLGHDLSSRSTGNNLECSPLSCNHMAEKYPVNRWCLVDDFDEALRAARAFAVGQVEPGPYVLLEVWASRWPDQLPA